MRSIKSVVQFIEANGGATTTITEIVNDLKIRLPDVTQDVEPIIGPPTKRIALLRSVRDSTGDSSSSARSSSLQKEIEVYELIRVPDSFVESGTLLPFWQKQRHLPLLQAVARGIYGVPASAADVERVWSACGRTVTSRRSKLSAVNLRSIQLINRNFHLFKGGSELFADIVLDD